MKSVFQIEQCVVLCQCRIVGIFFQRTLIYKMISIEINIRSSEIYGLLGLISRKLLFPLVAGSSRLSAKRTTDVWIEHRLNSWTCLDDWVIEWNMEPGNWFDVGSAWEREIEIGALVDLFIAQSALSFCSLFSMTVKGPLPRLWLFVPSTDQTCF